MKNWYNKEMLEKCKWSVENGYSTQKEYDALENQMKSFNLDNDVIVRKTVDLFLSIEPETEVSYSELLSKCLSFNALAFFDSKDLFELYDQFETECRKRKIKICYHEYGGPVGLPFNLGFWRVVGPLIKKIVYNLFYGCWGTRGSLSRTYVIFEKHKITYCHEPIDNYSHKKNCFIKIAYDPTNVNDYSELERFDDYDFNDVCLKAESLISCHKEESRVLDAIPASVIIYDDEKGKKIAKNLNFEETQELDLLFKKYMPETFKRAMDYEDE